MALSIILLIIGFVLLVKGADLFVEGSSNIAKLMKIPSIIIGLTIVAFGTSAPEAAVSIIAGIQGSNDISVGNVLGSNLFNLLIVLGVSAVISPVRIDGQIIKKEFPFMALSMAALLLMSFDVFFGNGTDNVIARNEALVLVMLMGIFLYSIITTALRSRNENSSDDGESKPAHSLLKSIIFTVGGLAGIIIGGEAVVDNAKKIALTLGMSDTLVGLTIVAVGTSLPELVTSLAAAKKGESDIAVGNVVGSNIFNVLFVLAVSAAITPMNINSQGLTDMVILMIFTMITYIFCVTKKTVNRPEGIVLSLSYAAYLAYAIIR